MCKQVLFITFSHFSDVRWVLRRLKSRVTWLFVQQAFHASNNGNIKTVHYQYFVRKPKNASMGFPQRDSDARSVSISRPHIDCP